MGDANDATNFPHKSVLTNRQVSCLHKAFANNSSASVKLSTTQIYKTIQSVGLFDKLLGPLRKVG